MTSDRVLRFSNDWFNESIKKGWRPLIKALRPKLLLEIGSYEGASACFLLDELYKNRLYPSRLVCVDHWGGGIEHQENNVDMNSVRDSFEANIKLARELSSVQIEVEVLACRSDDALARLIADGYRDKFDFIYIDGSHQAPDVLVDAVLSSMLIRKGGIIVFDDYFWRDRMSRYDCLRAPSVAIDAFKQIYFKSFEAVGSVDRQVIFKKI